MSYFNFFQPEASNEWNVTNDATHEFVEMYGVPLVYLPRTSVKEDELLGEDTLSSYDESFEIKMIPENYETFGGQGDLFSKLGLEIDDTIKLSVQQEYIESLLGEPPEEGDLIQFAFNKDLFEITFIEDEQPFYLHGKQTVYQISVKRFDYSGEQFSDIVTTEHPELGVLEGETESNVDDSLQDFQETLEFDETDPFGSSW